MLPDVPLIVALTMDTASHTCFTQLRDRYFPAWCNYLEAHITLFHHLQNLPLVVAVLEEQSRREPFTLQVTGTRNLGNGVAFELHASQFAALHETLQSRFSAMLTSQDRRKRRPHITIQNKVTAYKALQTLEALRDEKVPSSIKATGFSLWQYEKGPWRHLRDFPFGKQHGATPFTNPE